MLLELIMINAVAGKETYMIVGNNDETVWKPDYQDGNYLVPEDSQDERKIHVDWKVQPRDPYLLWGTAVNFRCDAKIVV